MRWPLAVLPVVALVAGCGSSSTPPSFSLAVAPGALSVQNGGAAQVLTVSVTPANGFNAPVSVALAGLPAGVTATPATLSVAPGQLGQISLAAAGAAVGPTSQLQVSGSAGSVTASAAATLAVTQAVSSASLSESSFDFGNDFLGVALRKAVVTVTNTGTTDVTLAPTLSGDGSFSISTPPASAPSASAPSTCGSSLAAGASCTEAVAYTPSVASGTKAQTAVLNLGLGNVPPSTAQAVNLTGTSAALPPGKVSTTGNPLVALYSQSMPFPGTVTVNFGADTNYGRQTLTRTTAFKNQTVNILVAGMPQNSSYHLRTTVKLANGAATTDVDHTFTNGASQVQVPLTVTTTAGSTPQPGVEQLTLVHGSLGLAVTDLQGNVLWSYALPNDQNDYEIDGAKMLANGNYLLGIGEGSGFPLTGAPVPQNAVTEVREIDLAGNIVREISVTDLNDELAAAGYHLTLQQFHHDVTPMPNGHWLILSNTLRAFTDLPGYPGATNVLGDVIIDLDQNLNPAWVWNAFDHLDVNRHPYLFPDWTHANALVYSPSDHNLIVSMRHQNWVLKIDYADGKGVGDVVWRLGQGGDFALGNGSDPTDWMYAQHYPSLFSKNSSGQFLLGLMDNGDDRVFPPNVTCGASGAPPCLYSTIPVFRIDETARTATLTFHQVLDPSLFSYFGGNTELLANGDIEYDLAGVGIGSDIFEVLPANDGAQTVWHMHLPSTNAYRGYRIPSLYPGVQW